ncbi:heavy-metal-associated domain-containing protein [Ohtaekwangia koreensis]|uniref:Heavy-metal-associated domain-containing protein n=1 Tax=Ohtaekwangia koreensis TaxID=688867 RepID=A0A1T5MAZ0_9BACT|nr:cation transporter [Ohtaekwangia koreensis]SKC85417.1 Heavy-metal-associated domain-containing protein [Ohtaekwangia koreensis]
MEAIKFKTNIKCSGCVEKVTPHLDAAVGEQNWEVDLNDPAKVLTVTADTNEAKVKEALEKAGYKAEKV